MRPQAGQVINNKYRLVRIIGDGGMGSVHEARHEVLGTTVALKFLHPELSRRAGLVQRFLQEARVSAQIQSPHVVRVVDVDQTPGGLAFIVMEYLEGKTLQTLYEDLYRAGVRLSYADALEYAMQMLEGVGAAHRAGVVHRDLKPDNVIIARTARGEPLLKLLDFGIAKLKVTGELDRGLTRPGVIMGTPEYMAPEQAYSADTVDARADIFSLGVMVFEMLAGRRPVGGDEPQQIAGAYLSGQISRLSDLAPDLPPGLCAAVHRAMAALPADRFASVGELRDAIQPFAHAARAPSALTPPPPEAGIMRSSGLASPAPSSRGGPPSSGAQMSATPTSVRNDGRYSAVPKTIPPEENSQHTTSGAPVSAGFSTPMGGFASDARGSAESGPGATPRPDHAQGPYYGAASAVPGMQASPMQATVSAAPYMPSNSAPRLGATSIDPAALDMSPRPGGTAVGSAPLYMDRSSAGASAFQGGAPSTYGAGAYQGNAQGYLPGTAPMEPMQAMGSASASGTRRPAKGPPLLLILLVAMGITGAVVGGVYLVNEIGRSNQRADAMSITPLPVPTTVVPTDPAQSNVNATQPPAIQPPAAQPPASKPRPTATTPAKPAPSSTTAPRPSGTSLIPQLPPFIIPSTFPFPMPLPPGAQPQSPQTGPQNPGPNPTPSSTGRRRVILVPTND